MSPRARIRSEQFTVTVAQRDLARGRTAFLLDGVGHSMPLIDLLANAYFQGLIDAAETMEMLKGRAA